MEPTKHSLKSIQGVIPGVKAAVVWSRAFMTIQPQVKEEVHRYLYTHSGKL
jgi:hypothetical protein